MRLVSGKESVTVKPFSPWQDLLARAVLGRSTCRGWPGGDITQREEQYCSQRPSSTVCPCYRSELCIPRRSYLHLSFQLPWPMSPAASFGHVSTNLSW